VVFFCCCGLSAQSKSPTAPFPQTQSVASKPAKKKPPEPKLTPQQEQGLRLLKSAEAEAAGLEPAMRTYVLWQVSHGYRKVDPGKADAVLRSAFAASRAIEEQAESEDCHMEQVCHVQIWLHREILEEILGAGNQANPGRVEKLLPQASPEVKKRMLESLASVYVRKQNFDRARQLLGQMDENRYSYGLAGELVAAMPASRQDERLAVFSQALHNFQNRSLTDLDPDSYDDFGILLIRFWRELPPSLALDAIDTILERSKDRDDSKKAHSVTLTLFEGKSLAFGSEYEYRLFQLMPILKELDPSKAERLLGESGKARLALDRYPGGMQSLDPNYYGDKPPDEKTMPVVSDVRPALDDDPMKNSEYESKLEIDAQIEAQMQKVMEEVKKDPEKAYQDAMNLPLRRAFAKSGSPRASGLRQAAFGLMKDNPTLARTAMNEVRRLAQDVDPAWQALTLADVPDFYLKLGDEDGARSAIKDQVKLAEKLYAMDSDAGDPNLAFKGAWPSSNAWRNCIQQATKVSPAFVEEILSQIPEPDITGLQRVMYANALLGTGKSIIAVVEWHKDGRRSGIFMGK
jgi:hypothetical protein